jgi:hypothetical protein
VEDKSVMSTDKIMILAEVVGVPKLKDSKLKGGEKSRNDTLTPRMVPALLLVAAVIGKTREALILTISSNVLVRLMTKARTQDWWGFLLSLGTRGVG